MEFLRSFFPNTGVEAVLDLIFTNNFFLLIKVVATPISFRIKPNSTNPIAPQLIWAGAGQPKGGRHGAGLIDIGPRQGENYARSGSFFYARSLDL